MTRSVIKHPVGGSLPVKRLYMSCNSCDSKDTTRTLGNMDFSQITLKDKVLTLLSTTPSDNIFTVKITYVMMKY